MTGNEAFFLSLCFRGLSLTPGVPHKGLGLQPLYPDGSDGQRDRLSGVSLPGQMEHGLLGVVTGIGTAFVEDQVVLLESENRGHEEYGGGGGGGWREAWGAWENAPLHLPHPHFLVSSPPHSVPA